MSMTVLIAQAAVAAIIVTRETPLRTVVNIPFGMKPETTARLLRTVLTVEERNVVRASYGKPPVDESPGLLDTWDDVLSSASTMDAALSSASGNR